MPLASKLGPGTVDALVKFHRFLITRVCLRPAGPILDRFQTGPTSPSQHPGGDGLTISATVVGQCIVAASALQASSMRIVTWFLFLEEIVRSSHEHSADHKPISSIFDFATRLPSSSSTLSSFTPAPHFDTAVQAHTTAAELYPTQFRCRRRPTSIPPPPAFSITSGISHYDFLDKPASVHSTGAAACSFTRYVILQAPHQVQC